MASAADQKRALTWALSRRRCRYYTSSYGIELAGSSLIANPVAALAPAPSSPVSSQLGFTGQWTTFSNDSGVIAIHSILTTDNYVLLMERPGNREQLVRLHVPEPAGGQLKRQRGQRGHGRGLSLRQPGCRAAAL